MTKQQEKKHEWTLFYLLLNKELRLSIVKCLYFSESYALQHFYKVALGCFLAQVNSIQPVHLLLKWGKMN